MKTKQWLMYGLLLTIALLATRTAPVAYAADQVVTNCSNDTELRNDLTTMESGSGGTLTFNCGTATIELTSQLPGINATTTIDGGGKITLSGVNSVRLFSVNAVEFTLKNIVLEKGYGGTADGGAINNFGRLILDHATIQNSTDSSFRGGAIYTYGQLEISHSTLYNNKAGDGGAIFVDGAEVTITDSLLDNNTASDDGGAIKIVGSGTLTVNSTTFSNNSATHDGGAIENEGTIDLTDVTCSTNHANYGGCIENPGGTATLNSVTLDNNTSEEFGAGIYNPGGTIGAFNSTLSGNAAKGDAGGVFNSGNVGLVSVTLFGNSAGGNGGGILNYNANGTQLTLKNVIVANSAAGGNCAFDKAPSSAIFSLSSDTTCNFGAGHDSINVLLGPLTNNGGKTKTHLPQPSSPAIDRGTDDAPGVDQRGVTRPQGSAFDIGAVEVACGTPDAPVLLKPKNNGTVRTTTPKLKWQAARCAVTYNVIVKQGSKTGIKVFNKKNLVTTEVTTTALTKGKTYFWRVTGKNPNGKTNSAWQSFSVK